MESHLGPSDKSFEFLHAVVKIPRTQFVMPFPYLPNCSLHATLRAICKGQEDIPAECPQLLDFFCISICVHMCVQEGSRII